MSGLRLLDIRMPPAFAAAYPGPRFGIAGTRRLAGRRRAGPLIGTIIKPSVGLDARSDGGARRRALRRRHRLHQGRRAAVGRADLSVRRARPRGDARHRRRGRPHRQEGDVRLQPHRRPRPDAAASRHAARERRHLPDGEPELGRTGRHDRARPLQRAADPRPPQRLGLSFAPSAARLVLHRLAEALAAGGRRPHARQRPAEQVLRAGRERDRLGAGLPDADVRRQAVHRHAGLLVRADRRVRRMRPTRRSAIDRPPR